MSTESLRRDHFLIEKMMRALGVTAELLKAGKSIPAPFLEQAIDFTKNFTNVCHHGKEEDSLFPALEKGGMPREGGPIARMLFEHEVTRQLAEKMESSAKEYLQSGKAEQLIADIQAYTGHVSQHLTKENFRLFVMADMMLKAKTEQMNKELAETEAAKLVTLGRTRSHYEQLVDDYDAGVRQQAQ
jgi:hemerythrin-like domain-containing protein